VRAPSEIGWTVQKEQREEQWASATFWQQEGCCLERREHTRYDVRAPVEFEWIDKGVLHRGRGLTRDISAKGMFIYSASEPPTKADLQVEVFLRVAAEAPTSLRLIAKSLVVRVESAASPDAPSGFAILNRSHGLLGGLTSIGEGGFGL
jgi:hypothetical protein